MKKIEIISANENNLKNICTKIPINKITVVTGVSGSGKSSLVFDTIYAESERIFLESMCQSKNGLSVPIKKPKVFKINNLLPSIAISQRYANKNPRSTVGTVTDISKYVRLLFAKIASLETNKLWVEGDFSYNNPKSWCERCKGMGEEYIIDYSRVLDLEKSINEGAIFYWNDINKDYYKKLIIKVSEFYNISRDVPLKNLPSEQLDFILNGISENEFTVRYKNYRNQIRTKKVFFEGVCREIQKELRSIDRPSTYKSLIKFLKKDRCSCCRGGRLKQQLLEFVIYGKRIDDFNNLSVSELKSWMMLHFNVDNDLKDKIFFDIGKEIVRCITNLEGVKLGYLSLDRAIPTLSGGEIQRLRLANQLSCSLSGLLYVLDEPTKGLHINDIRNIVHLVEELKARGNTVLIVEHNGEIIRNADYIIDIGPRGGVYGGEIIFEGTPNDLLKSKHSLTAQYLKDYKKGGIQRTDIKKCKYITIRNATFNNIKEQNFIVPLHHLVCITGASGSGKSTFVEFILEPSIKSGNPVNCENIEGISGINGIIKIDQSPIGRSPKSNVATYTGLFDIIRNIFAMTDEAKKRGYTKSHFSFNLDGGRCDDCKGDGVLKIDMSFMGELYIECPTCKGKRYMPSILEIEFNGKNIYDVLSMSVLEAYEFFKLEKRASDILKCLIDVGLDYLKIGQSSLTISGGEAQRIKLAKYLNGKGVKNTIYILDEPSSGLHHKDILKLIDLLQRIVNLGNTVVVVEHNLEIIKSSDYIIDMGDEGGHLGGKIVDQGPIGTIKRNRKASIYSMI